MHIIPLLSNSWNKDLWHLRIQKVLSEWSNTDNVFFWLMGWREDRNATKSGPLSARQRNDNGPTLNAGLVAVVFQGIRTSIAKEPYIFVIFQGGGSGPPFPPSGSAHVWYVLTYILSTLLKKTDKPIYSLFNQLSSRSKQSKSYTSR